MGRRLRRARTHRIPGPDGHRNDARLLPMVAWFWAYEATCADGSEGLMAIAELLRLNRFVCWISSSIKRARSSAARC